MVQRNLTIDELKTILFNKSEERARTLINTGELNGALRDATFMINCIPESSKGYLLGGDIYDYQCKLIPALELYNKALNTVSCHDTKYMELCTRRMTAYEKLQNKSSTVSLQQLPVEISSLIASYIPVNSKIQLAYSCKALKNAIQSQSSTWHYLDFGRCEGHDVSRDSFTNPIKNSLLRFGVWVQSIKLNFDQGEFNECDQVLGFMKRCTEATFGNVRSLTVISIEQQSARVMIARCRSLVSILEILSPTLMSLDIQINLDGDLTQVVPADLKSLFLSTAAGCPCLTHLKLYLAYHDFNNIQVPNNVIWNITSFYLKASWKLNVENIASFFRACPRLDLATLVWSDDSSQPNFQDDIRQTRTVTNSDSNNKNGVRILRMCLNEWIIHNLLSIIRFIQESLQELHLMFDVKCSDDDSGPESDLVANQYYMMNHRSRWYSFSNFKMDFILGHLTQLNCRLEFAEEHQCIVTSIIQNSPALEHVIIHEIFLLSHKPIHVLSSLTKLRQLELKGEPLRKIVFGKDNGKKTAVDLNRFLIFVNKHQVLGQQSPLRVLKMETTIISKTVLLGIGELTMLQEISLIMNSKRKNEPIDVTETTMNEFIAKLNNFASLYKITIGSTYYLFTDRVLETLGNSHSLTNISLQNIQGITTLGIQRLIEVSTTLNELVVSNCPLIDPCPSILTGARQNHFSVSISQIKRENFEYTFRRTNNSHQL